MLFPYPGFLINLKSQILKFQIPLRDLHFICPPLIHQSNHPSHRPGGRPFANRPPDHHYAYRLLARVVATLLHLFQHLFEVIARGHLQRWELLVGH